MFRARIGVALLLVSMSWVGLSDRVLVLADDGAKAPSSAMVGTWAYVVPGHGANDDGIVMTGGSRLSSVILDFTVATPYPGLGLPDPNTCTATPRTRDDVTALVADAPPPPGSESVDREADLPKGEPVDGEVLIQIVDVASQFVACINNSDYPRWLGMLSDNAIRHSFDAEELNSLFDIAGTPVSDASGETQTTLVAVRDVRLLPDGRVGAVVEWGRIDDHSDGLNVDEVNFHIFVQSGDTWLLDEEISSFSPWYLSGEDEPDWSSAATPVAS